MSHILRTLVVAAAIAASLVSATPSGAGHMNVRCDMWEGNLDNNMLRSITYAWINWSRWYGEKDYIARRYSTQAITYEQWAPGGSGLQTTTSNGFDFYRSTSIQRAGYTSAYMFEDEWSHTNC